MVQSKTWKKHQIPQATRSLHVLINIRRIVRIIKNCTHRSILKYEFTTESTTEMNTKKTTEIEIVKSSHETHGIK
jgi:hypothetical protein